MRVFTVLAIGTACLSGTAPAQGWRHHHAASARYKWDKTHGVLRVKPAKGKQSCDVTWRHGSHPKWHGSLPLAQAGTVCWEKDGRCFVTGLRVRGAEKVGTILCLRLVTTQQRPKAIQVVDERELRACDPLRAVFHRTHGGLYCLDATNKRLVFVSWDATRSKLGDLVEVATVKTIPMLRWGVQSRSPAMKVAGDNSLLLVKSWGLLVDYATVTRSKGGPWGISNRRVHTIENQKPAEHWVVRRGRSLGHADPIAVQASSGTALRFRIVDMDSKRVVGRGTSSASGEWVELPMPAVVKSTPGRRYRVIGSGLVPSSPVAPLVRYEGRSKTGLGISQLSLVPERAFAGNRFLSLVSRVTAAAGGKTATRISGVLLVNWRDPQTGKDPIDRIGPQGHVLRPRAAVLIKRSVQGTAAFPSLVTAPPASTVGQVLLFQILASDGKTIAATDIVGVAVRRNRREPPEPAQGGVKQAAADLRAWAEGEPFKPLTSNLTTARALIEALRVQERR